MPLFASPLIRGALPGAALCLLIGLAAAAPPVKPPPRNRAAAPVSRIDYDAQIKPLLTAKCGACHGNGTKLGDFEIGSRAALLKGGESGAAVVPGHADQSLLFHLVSGTAEGGRVMPPKGARLTPKEVALLKAWINQGASFGKQTAQAAPWRAPLLPRMVKVPPAAPGSGLTNPIDLLLQPYFKAHPLPAKSAKIVDDRTYARRVYLDITGLLPPPDEMEAFVADKAPDKRARLVRQLLGRNEQYAEHFLTFWNDMLRNDYAGTGYIDGGRTQITDWLYTALVTNLPYDKFVTELVNPTTPEAAGFAKGIVWRGTVNASQTPQMQAAQNVSQVFMGVNLKCASCHNSFVSTWKLEDAYGMASIYADNALELVHCDRPTGQVAKIKFIYPELGSIDADAPRAKRMEQLATALTARQNGRLSRTLVNRLWARFMGRGLVEPTDEMDNKPWNPDLLDWLAFDFAANGYDIKKTIERIVTSRAYQMPAMGLKSDRASDNFVFTGPAVKRLSAEQFTDAVGILTGVWSQPASGAVRISKGNIVLGRSRGEKSVKRFETEVMRNGAVPVDVDVKGAEFVSLIATDGGDNANVDWVDWVNPVFVDEAGKETSLTRIPWYSATTGYGKIQIDNSVVEKPLRLQDRTYSHGIGTHANSVITYLLPPGTTRFRALVGPDTGATEQKDTKTSVRIFVVTGPKAMLMARASASQANPLTRALGRPNREQVVTQRSTVATTLQALELTNGQTLSQMLRQGAQTWTTGDRATRDANRLVNAVYQEALSRPPTPAERKEAVALIGSPVRPDGVEDLLWAITMQPEFQLVY